MKAVKESASGAEAKSSRSPPVSKNEAVLTYYGSIPHGMNDWLIIWRHPESQKYKIDSLAKRSIMNPLCVNMWIQPEYQNHDLCQAVMERLIITNTDERLRHGCNLQSIQAKLQIAGVFWTDSAV